MESSILSVYEAPFSKLQMYGEQTILDIPDINYSLFISEGATEDVSFEEECIRKYDIKNRAFGKTIGTDVYELINKSSGIFVKITIRDVDTSFIQTLTDEQLNKVEQIIINYHISLADVNITLFQTLNKTYRLVHFNKFNSTVNIDNKGIIPKRFECTYIHKRHLTPEPKPTNDMLYNTPTHNITQCLSNNCDYVIPSDVRNNETLAPEEAIDIIGITICVKFHDIFKHMLANNAKFLKKWYIVTSPADKDTVALISESGLSNVHVLIYNDFYKSAKFNFGGGRRFAQDYIRKRYKTCNVLFLDADIYLPSNFKENLPKILHDNIMYGVSQRNDYWLLDDFINEKNAHPLFKPDFKPAYGFFQLYKQNPKYLYKNSYNCSKCDTVFRKLFPTTINLNIDVKHLGRTRDHWDGRKDTTYE